MLLQPNANPAAATYQLALSKAGIPLTSFAVDDIEKEYQRRRQSAWYSRRTPTWAAPGLL